ncbi:HET-domain-containing protein [Daldinia caldariorum]|uniref:HET-domain-containing protein n=1 Tax=Daldinia caldariorum TaxID=326644 RepID=UPI002007412F|nr:HET-domain-containing protein [Daldinia caldariorum]KAI1470404.1 HET-domain-containing protein [Daldinia caldariorum]
MGGIISTQIQTPSKPRLKSKNHGLFSFGGTKVSTPAQHPSEPMSKPKAQGHFSLGGMKMSRPKNQGPVPVRETKISIQVQHPSEPMPKSKNHGPSPLGGKTISTPFEYHPLTRSGEIRVFTLDPAPNREAPLKGSFKHVVVLTEYFTDHYVALSYVWGDNTTVGAIDVDGHKIGIGANLTAALRDLRHTTRALNIWIDALCIDQKNIPERNKQVSLMKDIYSTASSTIIYLGPPSPDAEFIFQQIGGGAFRGFDDASSNKSIPAYNGGSKGRIPLKGAMDITTASSQFLARPWFSRAWTFQELALSRDPWIQCGVTKVRWMDLCNFLTPLLRETPSKGGNTLTWMNKVHDALYTHHNVDPEILNLWRILKLRGDSQATDPRDLIYANMGLHKDRPEVGEFVQVDYNKTAREVFIDVGLYMMKYHGLGRAVSNISNSPLRSSLPSWVPDWGFNVKLESPHGAGAYLHGVQLGPPTSEQDVLLIKSHRSPLVVTHISSVLLPRPRSPKEGGLGNVDSTGGSGYFSKASHSPVKGAVSKVWAEYGWLRRTLEDGGRRPMDWLNGISNDNACQLVMKMYDDRVHDPRIPSRIALLNNSVAAIVDEKVRVGDSIVALESISFYQGGSFHVSKQEFPAQVVVRKLESDVPSRLDSKIVAAFPRSDKYVGRRQHCRLVAPQVVRIEETTAKQESLLIVH